MMEICFFFFKEKRRPMATNELHRKYDEYWNRRNLRWHWTSSLKYSKNFQTKKLKDLWQGNMYVGTKINIDTNWTFSGDLPAVSITIWKYLPTVFSSYIDGRDPLTLWTTLTSSVRCSCYRFIYLQVTVLATTLGFLFNFL